MIDESHQDLLAHVASMYFEQDMTQNAIAAQLGLSRVKVYRLLKQARAEQVVQITINWVTKRDPELEAQLRQTFGLSEALVLTTLSPNLAPTLKQLGRLGATCLERVLTDGCTMAICLGRTSYETVNAISPTFQAKVRVAQAVGSMAFALQEIDSATLARDLAHKLGGEVLYLTSPLLGDSVADSEVIRGQRNIQQTLQAARQADVALTGIGNLDPANSGFGKAGALGPDELAELVTAGAAGDMAGQIFNIDGEWLPCDYNRRIIGITLVDLRQIPVTIATALGQPKARAILGALRTGAVNVLCTDDQAAREVLRLNQTTNS